MKNLRKLRTEQGISQQTLAEKFHLSQQSIYKYENGLAEPDIRTLKKFAEYFHVSIDYLVGFSDQAQERQDIPAKNPFTPAEINMIQKLRKLSPEVRSSVQLLIEHLNEESL